MPRPADLTTAARRRAAAMSGHRGDERSARRSLDDPAGPVRATALGALARMGVLSDDDLDAFSADPDAVVRSRVAELAVGLATTPRSLARLGNALVDPDPSVVEAGCFALGEAGEAASPRVDDLGRVAGQHRDPLCREAAVAALGAIGDRRGLPAILEATADKPAVRRRAVLALAPFSGDEVDAALERALSDRDWQVRQAAEDLTGRTT